MEEIWKPVLGYEGYYEVSNLGRVKSLERVIYKSDGIVQRRKEYIKKPQLDSDGYLHVGMCVEGGNKKVYVHRLVAEAFVPGYFDGAEVNHKDFNRINNCCQNLEWVTHSDNIGYTVRGKRHVSQFMDYNGKNNPNYGNHRLHDKYSVNKKYALEKQSRPRSKNGRAISVIMISADGIEKEFGCLTDCAEYLINHKISKAKTTEHIISNISKAVKNKTKFLGMLFK